MNKTRIDKQDLEQIDSQQDEFPEDGEIHVQEVYQGQIPGKKAEAMAHDFRANHPEALISFGKEEGYGTTNVLLNGFKDPIFQFYSVSISKENHHALSLVREAIRDGFVLERDEESCYVLRTHYCEIIDGWTEEIEDGGGEET